MILLEKNKIIAGKINKKVEKPVSIMTQEDLNNFVDLLSINPVYSVGIEKYESANEYYEIFELMDKSVASALKDDLFYSAKLGYFYQGVPSKLVYLIVKAMGTYDTPNNLISALDSRVLNQYSKGFGNDISIKDVIENVLQSSITLVTEYNKVTKFKDCFEVYVPNVDRIVIVPEDMYEYISAPEDINSIEYVENVGVCVQGIPLRTCNGRLGITKNEFDLRGCF